MIKMSVFTKMKLLVIAIYTIYNSIDIENPYTEMSNWHLFCHAYQNIDYHLKPNERVVYEEDGYVEIEIIPDSDDQVHED